MPYSDSRSSDCHKTTGDKYPSGDQSPAELKNLTVALLSFLISLMVYSWIGFLWVIYNSIYATSSGISASSGFVTASAIQSVVFVSILGAFATGVVAYIFERELRS